VVSAGHTPNLGRAERPGVRVDAGRAR
jgi:hypothetical protein